MTKKVFILIMCGILYGTSKAPHTMPTSMQADNAHLQVVTLGGDVVLDISIEEQTVGDVYERLAHMPYNFVLVCGDNILLSRMQRIADLSRSDGNLVLNMVVRTDWVQIIIDRVQDMVERILLNKTYELNVYINPEDKTLAMTLLDSTDKIQLYHEMIKCKMDLGLYNMDLRYSIGCSLGPINRLGERFSPRNKYGNVFRPLFNKFRKLERMYKSCETVYYIGCLPISGIRPNSIQLFYMGFKYDESNMHQICDLIKDGLLMMQP